MKHLTTFDLPAGEIINGKYEILELLGKGWEGEVYLVRETSTGIERAAKFFFPKRDVSTIYAKKLHKLRYCPIVILYSTQETYFHDGKPVSVLISEFIEGELLSEFLKRQPGKRLPPFVALHLLHTLASGMEVVHQLKEYHGDLHTENLMVQRFGLRFELKVLDFTHHGAAKREHIHHDVIDMIHIFYEVLGGKKHYARLPPEIKDICCGLKRSIILKKYNTAGKLRAYLENLEWK